MSSNSVMRAFVLSGAVSVAAGLQPALCQEAGGSDEPASELTGEWTLNRALSDDPAELLRGMGGRARPRPGVPGASVPAPREDSPGEVLRRSIEGFSLETSDSTVAIVYPDRRLALSTDGQKQRIQVTEDLEVEYWSWWDDGRLFIERELDGGVAMTEEYWVQPGTGRLHVRTRVEGEALPRPIAFMRVYQRAPGGAED